MENQTQKSTAKAVEKAVEAKKIVLDKQVFEGTVAGKKFLFLATVPELKPVAEVPAGKTAEQVALENSAELLARAKANHNALKALFKAWSAAKRAEKAQTPEGIALAKAKAEAKAKKALETAKKRAEAIKARAEAKLEAAKKKAAELEAAAKAAKA